MKFGRAHYEEGTTYTHIQQGFIYNMAKGMRGCAINCHCGSYPDSGHHVSDLRDNMVGEEPSTIILKNRHEH